MNEVPKTIEFPEGDDRLSLGTQRHSFEVASRDSLCRHRAKLVALVNQGYDWLFTRARSGHWRDIKRTSLATEALIARLGAVSNSGLTPSDRAWLMEIRDWIIDQQENLPESMASWNEELWDTNQAIIALQEIDARLGIEPDKASAYFDPAYDWIKEKYGEEDKNWEGEVWETVWSIRSLAYANLYGKNVQRLNDTLGWLRDELQMGMDAAKRPFIRAKGSNERSYDSYIISLLALASFKLLGRELAPGNPLVATCRNTLELCLLYLEEFVFGSEHEELTGSTFFQSQEYWAASAALRALCVVRGGASPEKICSEEFLANVVSHFERTCKWDSKAGKVIDTSYALTAMVALLEQIQAAAGDDRTLSTDLQEGFAAEPEHSFAGYKTPALQADRHSEILKALGSADATDDAGALPREELQEIKRLLMKSTRDSQPANPDDVEDPRAVFLAHQFGKDHWHVQGLKMALEKAGFRIITGEDTKGYINQVILQRIRGCRFFIALMRKYRETSDGKCTTSPWILQESGAALGLDKKVAFIVEDGVEDIGGLHGSWELCRYESERDFVAVAEKAVEQLKAFLSDS